MAEVKKIIEAKRMTMITLKIIILIILRIKSIIRARNLEVNKWTKKIKAKKMVKAKIPRNLMTFWNSSL